MDERTKESTRLADNGPLSSHVIVLPALSAQNNSSLVDIVFAFLSGSASFCLPADTRWLFQETITAIRHMRSFGASWRLV